MPNVSSIACLNMSNCAIHSMFKGEGTKARLNELTLAGALFKDISKAFSYFDSGSLSFLDLSNSSLRDLSFLTCMHALEHLDLSGNLIGDDLVEFIASVGANLRTLNLSNTRVSSAGIGILSGHVPKLETILLSSTQIDDHAISYIGLIPSLKVVNLKDTNLRGLIQQSSSDAECVSSLSALENLKQLERLNLEETPLKDEALSPVSSFKGLSHLLLRSSFLTDTSLQHLSSIPKLITLSMQDAVLTNSGIDSFNPTPSLKVLDLTGCWLLTKDILLAFHQRHPQVELRHELVCTLLREHTSPSGTSTKSVKQRRVSASSLKAETAAIIGAPIS